MRVRHGVSQGTKGQRPALRCGIRGGTGMTNKALKTALIATTAIVGVAAEATAGGFAIREQSAQFQGSSFAGSAAGG